MKIIIFDVEHGFCAFVKSPNGYGLMIDCGRKGNFSPARYIFNNEAENLVPLNSKQLAKLVISHPHDDHLQDIKSVKTILPPAILLRQYYDWSSLKESGSEDEYANLDSYVEWQLNYNRPATDLDWGMEVKFGPYLNIEEAKAISEDTYVNNSSIPVFIEWPSHKIAFTGDLMEDGWRKLLEKEKFCNNLKGTTIFVTSHHGHKSGFCRDIYDIMGKPMLNIVSAHRKDPSVHTDYSSDEFASGIEFNGESRKMLSTRKDGTIFIEIVSTKWWIWGKKLPNNA